MLSAADYLDLADGFMGLGHADRLGRIFIGQDLSAAKVISSKDDPIYEIFWFTGTWHFPEKAMSSYCKCCSKTVQTTT